MWTYTRLDGTVLDLTRATPDEQAYLEQCAAAYGIGLPWRVFTLMVEGLQSPLVQVAGGRVTREVWNNPVFQAARDMEDRLGIAQGHVAPDPGDDVSRDAFADEWIPATEAANRASVSLTALHKAIGRRALIARPTKPGGKWLLVSGNSLARWMPMAIRQAAGRKRASLAAAGGAG